MLDYKSTFQEHKIKNRRRCDLTPEELKEHDVNVLEKRIAMLYVHIQQCEQTPLESVKSSKDDFGTIWETELGDNLLSSQKHDLFNFVTTK